MINLFRKIRRRLLAKNKFWKYLPYAFGEIVLVVIGILIALQINNWNEFSKERELEIKLLNGLRKEILTNLQDLEVAMDYHRFTGEAAKRIVEIYRTPNQSYRRVEIDSLLDNMFVPWTYDPRYGLIKSTIATGELKFIRNDEIRLFITSFEDMVIDINEAPNRVINLWHNQLYPRLYKYWSNISKGGFITATKIEKSQFSPDYRRLFGDRILENLFFDTMMGFLAGTTIEEELLKGEMQEILLVIDDELEELRN